MQTQHACPLHRQGHRFGLVRLFQFPLAHKLFHLNCLFPPYYERIPKRNTRKGARFSLALSLRNFSLRGGRGERCSIHHGGQETTKEGEKETQKNRETKAESWKEGEEGEGGWQGEDRASALIQPGVCSQLLPPPARPQLSKFPKTAWQRTKPLMEQTFRRCFMCKHHLV